MSTDRFDFDHDDDLRALLRGGDPARVVPPADPAALASLLEDIMSADLDIRPETDEAPAARRRTPLTWLVAAAAAVVIAGAGGFAVSQLAGGDDSPTPSAGSTTSDSPAGTDTSADTSDDTIDGHAPLAGQTTSFEVADASARCAPPDPAILAQYPQAFEGQVTAISGDTVTLTATDVYAGDVGQTVQVSSSPVNVAALVKKTDFQVGGTYLVAVFDGQVSLCYGGPADQAAPLFEKAFVR
ncbi:hypothetical protein G5V58_18450 [Nocardioides anomalus]|uniref:Uncharacterized protein n=1 Tax=Nocardioides anomalus TaxID=2712223 RepID=A0A6G6WH62_9ACTN|nr:hypothetical protein [Nocardioides anomalus]QIG44497.1 hypothetical protein G5V58_18450 [Nocardioides anomalus]